MDTYELLTNFKNDYDQVDYVDKLRENIIDAYVGILQSMCPDGYDKNPQLVSYVFISCNKRFRESKPKPL